MDNDNVFCLKVVDVCTELGKKSFGIFHGTPSIGALPMLYFNYLLTLCSL